MELDDLRRQWQQPDPPDPPLEAGQISRWLARGSGGLVAKMQRNARAEAVLTMVLTLGAAVALPFISLRIYQLIAGMMAFLGLGLMYYYYLMLALLRRMATTDGRVRVHLQRLCTGLRQFLSFNYALTLATGPVMMGMLFVYSVGYEMGRVGDFRLGRLLAVGGLLLVLGGLMYFGVQNITRRYLHWLYGRHLDRLDANLRELDEPGPGS